MHCTAQREPQELLGYWGTLVGLLCWSWEQGLWEKGQATSGYFLSFGIQSDCLFMEQRNSEASGTAQREKGMSVGVVLPAWDGPCCLILCSREVVWLAQGLRRFPAVPFAARNSHNL